MTSNDHPDLTRAAQRAAKSHTLIAGLLARWEQVFSEAPATVLDADPSCVTFLALCKRPTLENWAADVADVATACGIDADRLSSFLREATVFDKLASAPPIDSSVDGRLLAARDRSDEPE
jgi:hypothetical protein